MKSKNTKHRSERNSNHVQKKQMISNERDLSKLSFDEFVKRVIRIHPRNAFENNG